MMFFAIGFSSCEKDQIVSNTDFHNSFCYVDSAVFFQQYGNSKDLTMYCVADIYKNNYHHLKQKTNECSWTSYVLAATSIARAHGQYYPMNSTTLTPTIVRNKINHVKANSSNEITSIKNYSIRTDRPAYNSIKARLEPYSTYDEAVFGLLGERKLNGNGQPCLFITKSGNFNHYVIIWDVYWTGLASSSSVYITDPLDGETSNFSTYNQRKKLITMSSLINNHGGDYFNFLYFD